VTPLTEEDKFRAAENKRLQMESKAAQKKEDEYK
jgi:hypothetical protein